MTDLGRTLVIIVAGVALAAASFSAWAQPQPAVIKPLRVEFLNLGMDKNEVLAGLTANYTLSKEDLPVPDEETWRVEDKAPNADSMWYEIHFSKNKLASINTHLQPLLYGDAVRLAKELFSQLSWIAEPPQNPDKISSMINQKWAVVTVGLQQINLAGEDMQQIFLNIKDSAFVIEVNTKTNGSAFVHLRRVKSTPEEPSKK